MARWHPYKDYPDHAFWSRSISRVRGGDVDPVAYSPKFIRKTDRIATAGSCFAQHLARRLQAQGYSYYVAEQIHPLLSEEDGKANGYGVFSARYGNIYTVRQLLQLFQRAFGGFSPVEDHWNTTGVYVDPLRPTVQPGGFATLAELRADRAHHLACVRDMFRSMDVFIFTLGLTEAWEDRRDGLVYPVCPGVADGVFRPEHHAFHNFTLEECLADLTQFMALLREVNPDFQCILTVSPVALAATAVDRSVLVSTTYSKSVLRVVCEEAARRFEHVHYFPSYEIITGPHAQGRYFAPDLRDVNEDGVDHVMRVFQRHFLADEAPVTSQSLDLHPSIPSASDLSARLVEVECEERLLDS